MQTTDIFAVFFFSKYLPTIKKPAYAFHDFLAVDSTLNVFRAVATGLRNGLCTSNTFVQLVSLHFFPSLFVCSLSYTVFSVGLSDVHRDGCIGLCGEFFSEPVGIQQKRIDFSADPLSIHLNFKCVGLCGS